MCQDSQSSNEDSPTDTLLYFQEIFKTGFFYSDQALNCYVLSLRGNEKFKWGKNGTK